MHEQDQGQEEPVSPPPVPAGQGATFARFWRCALQVNPFDYSEKYQGQSHGLDEATYNQALVAKCRELDIVVVGIADHGNVDRLDRLRATLEEGGVVVFPGFEIASTEKVHMVCLFPQRTTKDQLNRYLGRLDLTDPADGIRPSSKGCLELATCIEELGGFWFAAHLTGTSGLLRLHQDGGSLCHIWQDSRVRVGQIPATVDKLEPKHREIIENRNVAFRRARPIAVINAKDVKAPDDLAKSGATSWVKMTQPSFDAFKIAFLDPESRVRLDISQEAHAAFESLQISGGYLDGLDARLSENLNTLIGGRGTGKSTLIECLRYVLEQQPRSAQARDLHQDIVKENLGRQSGSIMLSLRSAKIHGRRFSISRRYGEPAIVREASGGVSRLTPLDLLPTVEIFGQSEILDLAQDAASRLRLLDRFLPTDRAGDEQREAVRRKLAENAQRLAKAREDLDEHRDSVGRLPKLGEQLRGFHELGIEAKLARSPLFAREGQLVLRIEQELPRIREAVEALSDSLPDVSYLDDRTLAELPNAPAIAQVRGELETLSTTLRQQLESLRKIVTTSEARLGPALVTWRAALASGERDLEQAIAKLPNLAGKSGREVGTAYRHLTQEIERIRPLEAKVGTLEQLRQALERERESLVAELSVLRGERTRQLQEAVKEVNHHLEGKLRIELGVEADRTALRTFLVNARMEGVGEKRLAWVEEAQMTPLALARAIRGGSAELQRVQGVTPLVAEALSRLPSSKLLELETVELGDVVRIALNVAHAGTPQYRDIAHLSTGQKCTAVLHLLLLHNADPLVIDQPEDNLDNAFIAERIVKELRSAKTRRQFLFSTHNANIPVFGDAEWIGVLSATESAGRLMLQGSIDVEEVREQAAEILEGGKAAFNQRKEMYEF